MFPLDMGHACVSTIDIFEINKGPKDTLFTEVISLSCPENWNTEILSPFDAGPEGLVYKTDNIVISFKYTMVDSIKVYEIEVKLPQSDLYLNCEISR